MEQTWWLAQTPYLLLLYLNSLLWGLTSSTPPAMRSSSTLTATPWTSSRSTASSLTLSRTSSAETAATVEARAGPSHHLHPPHRPLTHPPPHPKPTTTLQQGYPVRLLTLPRRPLLCLAPTLTPMVALVAVTTLRRSVMGCCSVPKPLIQRLRCPPTYQPGPTRSGWRSTTSAMLT